MKLYELKKGTRIISRDNRIWNIARFDCRNVHLKSGCAKACVDAMLEVKKVKGGYLILDEDKEN